MVGRIHRVRHSHLRMSRVPEGSPEGSPERSPEQPTEPPPLVGVLFVHGIGTTKRGETLPWAGEPFYELIKSWLNETPEEVSDSESKVYMANTRLARPVPSEADAPPYAQIYFPPVPDHPSDQDPSWVLAESWWDAEFGAPNFNDLVSWGLNIGPWMIERSGPLLFRRIFRAVGTMPAIIWTAIEKAVTNEILRYALYLLLIVPLVPVLVALLLVSILGFVGFSVLGVLLQLFILVLLVVGLLPVPALRSMVQDIQIGLAVWLGDAYLMASSPVRFNAMLSQVRRDVNWLRDVKKCQHVAVIAHSGGAPVAYRALTGPKCCKAEVLITYGSGHSKVDAITKLLPKRNLFFAINPLVRVVLALGVLALTVYVAQTSSVPFLGPVPLATGIVIIVALIIAIPIFLTGLHWLSRRIWDMDVPLLQPEAPNSNHWTDYCAVADIVPDGLILRPGSSGNSGSSWTTIVDNLHSLVRDHGWYWLNKEQFVSPVAGKLWALGAPPHLRGVIPDDSDDPLLREASARRHNRVFVYMMTGLLHILSVPVLWFGLGPWVQAVGEFIRNLLVSIPGGIFGVPNKPSQIWAALLGMAAVVAVVALWHQILVFQPWRLWSRSETEAMYCRDFSNIRRDGVATFMLLSMSLPAIALILAFSEVATINGLQPLVEGVLTQLLMQGSNVTVDIPPVTKDIITAGIKSLALLNYLTTVIVAFTGSLFFWLPPTAHTEEVKTGRQKKLIPKYGQPQARQTPTLSDQR